MSVSADKIVSGEPIAMGTLPFRFDRTNHTLTCSYTQGVWRIKVDGLNMEGTLTLTDKTAGRHVKLKKEECTGVRSYGVFSVCAAAFKCL